MSKRIRIECKGSKVQMPPGDNVGAGDHNGESLGIFEVEPIFHPYRDKFVLNTALTLNRFSEMGKHFEFWVAMMIGRNCMDNHTTVEFGEVVMTFHDSNILIGTGTRRMDS